MGMSSVVFRRPTQQHRPTARSAGRLVRRRIHYQIRRRKVVGATVVQVTLVSPYHVIRPVDVRLGGYSALDLGSNASQSPARIADATTRRSKQAAGTRGR